MAKKEKSKQKKALFIDGNNYLHRAWWAVPEDRYTQANGEPANAIMGFFNILCADIRRADPDYVCVVFDHGKSWRTDIYPEYKSNRVKDEQSSLHAQIPIIKELLKIAGIYQVSRFRREADDLIGTLVRKCSERGIASVIHTNDKDMAQLVRKGVTICKPDRAEWKSKDVRSKFGVPPSKIVDLLTLVGDSVDCVPGINKVGYKTAAKLICEHGSAEAVLKATKSMSKALKANVEQAKKDIDFKLNRELVTINEYEKVGLKLKQMRLGQMEVKQWRKRIKQLGVRSLSFVERTLTSS